MNATVFLTFCLIVLARITDMTLATIRTVAIVQGRRAFAAVFLGFFKAVVYICAVAKVLLNIDHPVVCLGLWVAIRERDFPGNNYRATPRIWTPTGLHRYAQGKGIGRAFARGRPPCG